MSVQKFKSLDEASKALWKFNPSEIRRSKKSSGDYYKKVSNLYKLFARLSKFSATHGVFKFRSLEAAAEHRIIEMKKFINKS